jgi:transposase
VAVKAAHFARPPGLGLDGREHGGNISVRRGLKYSQNTDEKHGASTSFFNRCTWYLIPPFNWRRLYRDDPRAPAVSSIPQLMPVVVTAEPDAVATQPSTVAETIEIDLAGKYRVRVGSGVDAQALRRVLDVLERR